MSTSHSGRNISWLRENLAAQLEVLVGEGRHLLTEPHYEDCRLVHAELQALVQSCQNQIGGRKTYTPDFIEAITRMQSSPEMLLAIHQAAKQLDLIKEKAAGVKRGRACAAGGLEALQAELAEEKRQKEALQRENAALTQAPRPARLGPWAPAPIS